MAVALEVRVPLLDHVLYELVSGIDPDRRFAPPKKKQLLRDIALSGLDQSIFDRPKSGFVLPIGDWTRRGLQAEVERVLLDPSLTARAGLRVDTIRTLWKSYLSGRSGLYWSRIWALYILLVWCRDHDISTLH
jgi:asparagine synthase (glutamine-hydrolysing)